MHAGRRREDAGARDTCVTLSVTLVSRSPLGRRRADAGELLAQREYITAFNSVADAPNPEDDRRDRGRDVRDRGRRSPPASASSRVILEASGRRDPAEIAGSAHSTGDPGSASK